LQRFKVINFADLGGKVLKSFVLWLWNAKKHLPSLSFRRHRLLEFLIFTNQKDAVLPSCLAMAVLAPGKYFQNSKTGLCLDLPDPLANGKSETHLADFNTKSI
jgi:hypothetical protein